MRKIIFLILIASSHFCFAQLELSGTYQGRNIYIQNPHADTGKGFCITKILVNGKPSPVENTDAFAIQLDAFHFKFGDPVEIEIFHGENCMPKILTNDINPKLSLSLTTLTIDKDGFLNWTISGDTCNQPFIIEQYRWNKWMKVGEVPGNKIADQNSFRCKLSFCSGENRFRVKRIQRNGIVQISAPVNYTSAIPKPTYKINPKTKQVVFSAETPYEIYDSKGNLLKKGSGTIVDLRELDSDQYFLNYDNSMTDFYL
jgi:hypothetical protein